MGIGDALRNLAFKPEEEPVEPQEAPRATIRKVVGQGSQPRRLPVYPSHAVVRASQPDAEMARDIEAALATCKSRGYGELMLQMDVLQPSIADETVRLNAAIATVQAMCGLTTVQIRDAIQERINVLNKHLADVNAALANEVMTTKAQNEQHLTQVRARIAELTAELGRLQSSQADAERVLGEIADRSAEVAARLNATIQPYFDELNGLIGRIR